MMQRFIKIAAVVSILHLAPAVNAAELKIGHIDLQRLVAQSDAGKSARENFTSKNKQFQDEINTRSEKLKKLKEELEAALQKVPKGEKPSQAVLDKDKEYRAQARELQRLLDGYNQELKVYDAELTRKVLEEFSPILAEYGKTHKYDYILRGLESMAFANEKRDLTEELIKEFNKKRKK